MKIAFFAPYGAFKKESSLIFLVANYLGKMGAEIVQVRCNGVFNSCGRDERSAWNRTAISCLRCVREQRTVMEWGSFKGIELGSFLRPEDVLQTSKLINSAEPADLLRLEFRGEGLFPLCQNNFEGRFGSALPDLQDSSQMAFLKALLESAVYASAAIKRCLEWCGADLILSMSSDDVLGSVMTSQCAQNKQELALFHYAESEEMTYISKAGRDKPYVTRLAFDGLSGLKNDHRVWAPEIISAVNEISSYLGYGNDRTPAAR